MNHTMTRPSQRESDFWLVRVLLNPQKDPMPRLLQLWLIRLLGFPIAYNKLQPPAMKIKYLGARLFISRELQCLRKSYHNHTIQVRTSLKWFVRFLLPFNGRSLLKPLVPVKTLLTDPCLTGGGATDYEYFYEILYLDRVTAGYHIRVLVALNCLIALHVLPNNLDNCVVTANLPSRFYSQVIPTTWSWLQ